MGTSLEDLYTYMIISRRILLKMRNISDRSCRKNQNMRIMFDNFFPQNCAVYEIVGENMVEPYSAQMAV